MTNALAVSDVVNVSVSLSPIAAAVRNYGTLLILGSSQVIDVVQRIRSYTGLTGVGQDFGSTTPEYLAAQEFFSQSPQPTQVYIGAWAQTATPGLLHGGPLTAAQQLPSAWTGITSGGVDIVIDGTARNLETLNFSAVGNMPAVAAVVNTALGIHGTCTWNATYNRFEIVSATTGIASSVAYATAGAGTDISAQLALTAATGAIAPVAGLAAETCLAAVNALASVSQQWYGLYVASTATVTADYLAVAGFIEAANPSHVFGITTQDPNSTVSTSTTDLAAELAALGYNRTFTQYSSTNPYAATSALARAFTVDFTGSNTTITLKFKTEPGVVPEALTESQAATLNTKNCNVYASYQNGVAILQQGVMASGVFFDEIQNVDWFQGSIQTNVFNFLYGAGKVPQTDGGQDQIANNITQSCEAAVKNGFLAPGVWTGPNIGAIVTGQTLATGYYIYTPPVSSQSQADRAARKSVTFQVAAKQAGATHFANVLVSVNQ
jgi:hypothetical protein